MVKLLKVEIGKSALAVGWEPLLIGVEGVDLGSGQ